MATPKPKVGRPKKPPGERKGAGIRVRLNSDERQKVDRAASAAGLGLSEWARRRLLDGL